MRNKGSTAKRMSSGDEGAGLGPGATTLSAEAMRQLRDVAGISIWTWRPVENEVFHSNYRAKQVAQGAKAEEALALIDRQDRRRVRRRLEAAAASGRSGSIRFGASSGASTRQMLATYFQVTDDATPHMQIIVQDVTRATRAEQALRDSEDHYRNAVALNPEIPWLADGAGNIIEFGPRWTELVGLKAEGTLGDGWAQALHPDDLAPTLASWRYSIQTGEPVDIEYRVLTVDGEYLWMRARAAARRDGKGVIARWYGTLEDINARKLAVAALRDSEEFSRSILESSNFAIEVLDRDGRLIFMNGPGIEIMEVEDFELIRGRPYESFWPKDIRSDISEAIVRARNGETVRRTQFGPTAKGSPRWWDLSLTPIRDADGRVTRLLALSRDVTEAKRNEVEVVASARRLANVLESTMDSVVSVDTNWQITYMNSRAMVVFEELGSGVGRDLRDLFDGEATATFLERYREAMETQSSIAFEEYLPSAGAWYEVQAYGSALGLIVFFRDVTERRQAQQQLAHLARHDALTGLPNRMYFQEQLETALAKRHEQQTIAVLSVDLDDFKLVNDTLGHPAGDALLREVAMRLSVCAGPRGVVSRLGGDEFAVMLQIARPDVAADTAQAILAAILQPFAIEGEMVHIGASIGIAVAPRDGLNGETMLQNADVALYRVKGDQGRAYRYFEPEMDQALRERREMKRDLTLALQRNELSVVYQPQVEITSNRLTGFEALLRWHHPVRGPVSPAEFIPLAEESGLIEEIGAFVLEAACAEAMHWPEGITIAVNLSPAQFRYRAVNRAVAAALEQTGLPPGRLELEITESVLLDENAGALLSLEELHRMGISVALDDFGTGYSSLSYLRRFPFDKIKIDRSFISDLPTSEGSVAIVRAIIGLGRSLKTRVTGEGVETWEQLLFLRHEGCTEAQGYLFSQPLPAAQARALAQTRADAGRSSAVVKPEAPGRPWRRHG